MVEARTDGEIGDGERACDVVAAFKLPVKHRDEASP